MSPPDTAVLAKASAWEASLTTAMLQVAALCTLAAIILPCLPRTRPALRSAVAFWSLAGALLLPSLGTWLPDVELLPAGMRPHVLPAVERALPQSQPDASVAARGAQHERPAGRVGPSRNPHEARSNSNGAIPPGRSERLEANAARRRTMLVGTAVLLWLAGAGVLLVRLMIAHRRTWTWLRNLRPARGCWRAVLGEAKGMTGVRHPVDLRIAHAELMPLTCGWLRPTIVVPRGERWSRSCREAVLLHELAHVARRDCLADLIAQIACAVHWYNPLVWWLRGRLRVEREYACDARAVAAQSPSQYAGHLLHVAARCGSPSLPIALAMPRRSALEERLMYVLNHRLKPRALAALETRIVAALALVLAAGLAMVTPANPMAEPAETDGSPRGAGDQVVVITQPGNAQTPAEPRVYVDAYTLLGDLRSARSDAREAARETLAGLGPDDPLRLAAINVLLGDLMSDAAAAREQAAWSAGHVGGDALVDALIGRLGDENGRVRTAAAWALGEAGDSLAIEPLAATLRDSEPEPRRWSAWALGALRAAEFVPELAERLAVDGNEEVRRWSAWALGEIADPIAVANLSSGLADDSAEVRRWSAWALGEIADPIAVEALTSALPDEAPEVRRWVAWALGEIGDPAAVEALAAQLDDSSDEASRWAAWALGEIRDPAAVDALVEAGRTRSGEPQRWALWALGEIGDARASAAVQEIAATATGEGRRWALWALGAMGDPAALATLEAAAASPDRREREWAAYALVRMPSDAAVAILERMREHDDDADVRHAAAEALKRRAARLLQRGAAHGQEDPWMQIALQYVMQRGVPERSARRLATLCISQRERLERKAGRQDAGAVAERIARIRDERLIAGLESLARE